MKTFSSSRGGNCEGKGHARAWWRNLYQVKAMINLSPGALQNHLMFIMCRYKLVTSGENWHLLDGKEEGCTHIDESRGLEYVFSLHPPRVQGDSHSCFVWCFCSVKTGSDIPLRRTSEQTQCRGGLDCRCDVIRTVEHEAVRSSTDDNIAFFSVRDMAC